jgi:hypothetical protein
MASIPSEAKVSARAEYALTKDLGGSSHYSPGEITPRSAGSFRFVHQTKYILGIARIDRGGLNFDQQVGADWDRHRDVRELQMVK